MPIRVTKITEGHLRKLYHSPCWICREPFENIKLGSYFVIKSVRRSRNAHVDCAINKNWIAKNQIPKHYLVPLVKKI